MYHLFRFMGRSWLCHVALAAGLFSGSWIQHGLAESRELDAEADQRVRAMTKYFGDLQNFAVDSVHTMEMDSQRASERKFSDHRTIVVKQPNLLAVTATGESEGKVLCDGKQLFAYWPSGQRYLLSRAPKSVGLILQEEASMMLGAGRTVVQLAADDSYEQFLESVTNLKMINSEEVNGIKCDCIELSQDRARVSLWIEQGERPLLHKMRWKMQVDQPSDDSRVPSQVVAFSNWKVDGNVPKETFAIKLPKGAKQVATFRNGGHEDRAPHPLLGKELPNCELALLDGETLELDDFEEKQVVVLELWSTWCGPCVDALPIIERLEAKFADREVSFLAANLGDKPDDVRAFLKENDLSLSVALDPEDKLGDTLKANTVPMTAIIDQRGVVQAIHIGFDEDFEKTINGELEALLAGNQLAAEALRKARDAKRWGKAIPAGEKANNYLNALQFAFEFNLRTSVEAYKRVGSRDEKWDDAAIEFLTEVSRHFASAPGYKSQIQLIEMAKPVIELGCDDPLVQYCHGAMLQDAQQNRDAQAEGIRLVEQSYQGLLDRGYPGNRCFAAAKRIWNHKKNSGGDSDVTEKYLAYTKEHALETLLQDDLETNDGRTLYNHLNGFASSLPLEERMEFCEDSKQHEDDSPYVVNMLLGEYHLDAAWKSRGGGFASDVTEEGWEGFTEHMELSREAFEKAWEAAPTRPEAATAMVKVSMGASQGSPVKEMRLWFGRAVAAQFDYLTAYSHFSYGLMPRWHGSHEQRYEFGVECMETERYDTYVPYELLKIIFSILQDNQNSLGNRYVQRPGLYENARNVCQRYMEQKHEERNIDWWKTVWLGFAYLAEEWDDATRLLDELGADLDLDALGRFPLEADELVTEVRIHSSPHSQAIRQAFRAADQGREEEALAALTAIAEKNLQAAVASEVSSRLQGLAWNKEFAEGKSVSLMPSENLQGWKIGGGTWIQTPEGDLRGVSNKAGVVLQCQADFGTRWEIQGEIVHGESPYNPWDAGIMLQVDGRPKYSMMFNPCKEWVAVGPHKKLKYHQRPFKPTGAATKFVFRVDGDRVDVWLNEEHLIEDQQVEGLHNLSSYRLAIGAKYTWDGSTLTYKTLKIQQLEPDDQSE